MEKSIRSVKKDFPDPGFPFSSLQLKPFKDTYTATSLHCLYSDEAARGNDAMLIGKQYLIWMI